MYANSTSPILVGAQGTHKSTFCREMIFQHTVDFRRTFLAHRTRHGKNLVAPQMVAEADRHDITGLDLCAGFGDFAVERDTPARTGLVRHRAALDNAGYLQILVKTHNFLRVSGI